MWIAEGLTVKNSEAVKAVNDVFEANQRRSAFAGKTAEEQHMDSLRKQRSETKGRFEQKKKEDDEQSKGIN